MSSDRLVLSVLLVSAMLAIGTAVRPVEFAALRHATRHLLAAIAVNIVAVPAAALVVTAWMTPAPPVASGIFLAAVAGGGGSGALLAHHARGDIVAATALNTLLALSTVVAVPSWLWLMRDATLGAAAAPALAGVLTTVFLLQLLPLTVGIAVGHRWPRWAERLHRGARRTADVLLLATVVWFTATNLDLLRATELRSAAAMLVVVVVSLAVLMLPLGTATRRRAFAAVGLARNLTLALAIAANATQPGPTIAAVLTYGSIMYLVAGLLLVLLRCRPEGAAAPSWRCVQQHPST